MGLFFEKKPRFSGRYRLDGERGYRTFNVPAENADDARQKVQAMHPGQTITEFRAHVDELGF